MTAKSSLVALLRTWVAERLEVAEARVKTYSGEGFTYERGQIDLLIDLAHKLDEIVANCCVCGQPINGESMVIKGIHGEGLAHAGYTGCARGGDPYA